MPVIRPGLQRSDLPYIYLRSHGYTGGNGNAALTAAIAEAAAANYEAVIHIRPDEVVTLTDDFDFVRTRLFSEGEIVLTDGKTLTFGGNAVLGDYVESYIRLIWNGINQPSAAAPQVRIRGMKGSKFVIGYAQSVQLQALGLVAADASNAYNVFEFFNAHDVDITGDNGGWVNSNRITGRITKLTIDSTDDSYPHNGNIINGMFEACDIDIGYAGSNTLIGRFEGAGTIDLTADAFNHVFLREWDDYGNEDPAKDFGPTITDAGTNNLFNRRSWLAMRQFYYRADHVNSGAAAWSEISNQTIQVRAGDLVKFNVLTGTGIRAGLLLKDFDDTDISATGTASGTMTSISGFYGRTAGADMTAGSYVMQILQSGMAQIQWIVGASEQAALAVVETEVRGR